MSNQREQGPSTRAQDRLLEDVADLLEVRDELVRECDAHRETKTALKLQRDRADHYQAENTALNMRCDHLTTQVAEFRAQYEALAQAFESEGMKLARWVADQGVFLRERASAAEMKPYTDPARPLARLEVN